MANSKDILDKISYDFAYATGLGSVVVDVNGKEISPWYNFTSFCQHVRKLSEFYPLCKQCDRTGGLESFRSKQITCYRCHAGLVDFSIPIVINSSIVGFLACGQARVENDISLSNIISSDNNIERVSRLSDLWQDVPIMEQHKIQAAAQLLNTIVDKYLPQEYSVKLLKGNGGDIVDGSLMSGEQYAKIAKIINYINDNFSEDLNLERMACVANFSPCYFSRLFKKSLGEGFNSYLNRIRMKESRHLLEHTNWTVEKIARSVGYNDSAYFIRIFKRNYGFSPQFMRQHREPKSNNIHVVNL